MNIMCLRYQDYHLPNWYSCFTFALSSVSYNRLSVVYNGVIWDTLGQTQ